MCRRQAVTAVAADRAAGEEPVGQPHRAELEAAGGQRLAPLADAAARSTRRRCRRAACAGRTPGPPAGRRGRSSRASSAPEITSMSMPASSRALARNSLALHRLPHGARGDGPHRAPEAVGDLSHPPEGSDAAVDGVRGELLHVAAAVTEADDLPLARQGLEPLAADGPGHDEVEAVGADVEGGQLQARRRPTSSSSTVSVIEPVDASRDALEDALPEAGDLLETAADDVVRRGGVTDDQARSGSPRPGRPGTWMTPRGAVEPSAGRDDVGDPGAGQAVGERGPAPRLSRGLSRACWAASLHAMPNM